MNVPARRRFTKACAAVWIVASGLSGSPPRVAAESLLPLATESAALLPSGTVEAVLGFGYFKDQRFPPFTPAGTIRSQDLITAPQIGLRVGAGNWAEIQASFEFINLDETTSDGDSRTNFGAGDARLFTKVRLLKEAERRPGVGIRFGAKLPNASRKDRLGTDETDFGIEALASKDFGAVATHVNLGLLLLGNPGPLLGSDEQPGSGQDDLFTYSVAAVSRPFPAHLKDAAVRLVAEVAGWTGSRFDNDRAAAHMGLQLRCGGLTLYSGISAGLVTGSENFGVSAGLVYAFELERLAGLDE